MHISLLDNRNNSPNVCISPLYLAFFSPSILYFKPSYKCVVNHHQLSSSLRYQQLCIQNIISNTTLGHFNPPQNSHYHLQLI